MLPYLQLCTRSKMIRERPSVLLVNFSKYFVRWKEAVVIVVWIEWSRLLNVDEHVGDLHLDVRLECVSNPLCEFPNVRLAEVHLLGVNLTDDDVFCASVYHAAYVTHHTTEREDNGAIMRIANKPRVLQSNESTLLHHKHHTQKNRKHTL